MLLPVADKRIQLGPTGETARDNVKRLREEQHLTYAALSRRLTELGRPIATLGLTRIENGERRIDVDDLLALAVAFDVSPVTILLPLVSDPYKFQTEVTGTSPMRVEDCWLFFEGFKSPNGTESIDFVMRSRSVGRVMSPADRQRRVDIARLQNTQIERRIRTRDADADTSTMYGYPDPWDDDGDD